MTATIDMIPPKHTRFDIARQIPLAVVLGFVLQTGGALFWAGAAAERIAEVERRARINENAIERVVRLETQVGAMHEQLARIESKLDRLTIGAIGKN